MRSRSADDVDRHCRNRYRADRQKVYLQQPVDEGRFSGAYTAEDRKLKPRGFDLANDGFQGRNELYKPVSMDYLHQAFEPFLRCRPDVQIGKPLAVFPVRSFQKR